MEPIVMEKSWDGHAVMLTEDVQSALQIVRQCVGGRFVRLEDRITVATLRMDAKIMVERDPVSSQVGVSIQKTSNH